MKTVIIGGVAAGTKVAAKLKRECPEEEIIIYTKSSDISYAGCAIPYYIGGIIQKESALIVNTPQKFTSLTGVDVMTDSEVTGADPDKKQITVHGEKVSYDRLVIAVGASPIVPDIPGVSLPGVFCVRTPDDAISARKYAEDKGCKNAVIVGGGFIGLEVAENLSSRGIDVTVIDMAEQLLPGVFDLDASDYIRRSLIKEGTHIKLNCALKGITGNDVVTAVETSSGRIPCDIVFLTIGIRPSTAFLDGSGIKTDRGLIVTDEEGRTNIDDIYAVGDCALVRNLVTKNPQWSAMGSTANIAGRSLALNLSGDKSSYGGVLGTAVIKLSQNLSASRTGLTESSAKAAGFNVATVTVATDDKPHYYPGASSFITKIICDKETHKLLGAQILGPGNVDKMADIAVTGISLGAKVDDFINMDFSYAPPFSTAIHPFAAACSIMLNKLTGKLNSVTPMEYINGAADNFAVIDAHPVPKLQNAEWVDVLKPETITYGKNEKLLIVCSRGKRAYLLHCKLRAMGYTNTYVLESGSTFNDIK